MKKKTQLLLLPIVLTFALIGFAREPDSENRITTQTQADQWEYKVTTEDELAFPEKQEEGRFESFEDHMNFIAEKYPKHSFAEILEIKLNELGEEGWELVSKDQYGVKMIFKRIRTNSATSTPAS